LFYEIPGGWTLLVGATDADNDYLSLKVAEPADWWFHADKVPGSHVVLRAKKDEEPDRETLRQAAAVAAYHSKARHAGTVPVYCTRARHVTKPRGAKAGTVHVSAGKILKVRPDNSFAVRVRGENMASKHDANASQS
jgi:predicted ribosome quality control (RQC) complex YloA/Tae2 family protein